jgi:hypothetical protein
MKNLFFIILCTLCVVENASSQKSFSEGVYKGGICGDEAVCGYWLLKSNKTFVYCDFQGNYIKHFGSGNWSMINDSIVSFNFSEIKMPILEESIVNYTSETKPSFDSLYITGQLTNMQNKSISFASILVNGKYQTVSTPEGNFSLVLPRTVILNNLIVINKLNGYKPLELVFNKNNNHHNLKITMSSVDSATSYSIYSSNPLLGNPLSMNRLNLKLNKTPGKKVKNPSISYIGEDRNWMIEMLNKAKIDQPALTTNIDQLLAIINK